MPAFCIIAGTNILKYGWGRGDEQELEEDHVFYQLDGLKV